MHIKKKRKENRSKLLFRVIEERIRAIFSVLSGTGREIHSIVGLSTFDGLIENELSRV